MRNRGERFKNENYHDWCAIKIRRVVMYNCLSNDRKKQENMLKQPLIFTIVLEV